MNNNVLEFGNVWEDLYNRRGKGKCPRRSKHGFEERFIYSSHGGRLDLANPHFYMWQEY